MKCFRNLAIAALLLAPTGCGMGSDGETADAGSDATDAAPDALQSDAGVDAAEAGDVAAEADSGPTGYPDALPFTFARPQVGEPLSVAEITDFTREITGFWKDVGYFPWVRMHSHGLDPSAANGMPDYALWWQDTAAIKTGDTVLFEHRGRADNLTLRTCKVLANTAAGYLMFGDDDMRWLTTQYSKGLAALSRCMEFGADDPVPYLQARAIFTHGHSYETIGGRKVEVDYSKMAREEESWNAKIVHNPDNPYWGDIYLVNQRSKDDVPHMYRVAPMLMRLARDAPDADVREAAALALEYLRGFAKDIVDSGYQIRTKFEDGEAVVPKKEDGSVKDLASLVLFETLIPNAECDAKLGSALLAYGEPLGNACGDGNSQTYEDLATTTHYFNYAIVRYFHIAAVGNALMAREDDIARGLLEGLAARSDRIMHDPDMPNRDDPVWDADAAAFLLAAAAVGLPLTHEEARLVRDQYLHSVEHYRPFAYWDPWDDSVPDGEFGYKPDRGTAVRPTELGYLLEYCYSPLKNPAGAEVVDCEVVSDPSRWGQ